MMTYRPLEVATALAEDEIQNAIEILDRVEGDFQRALGIASCVYSHIGLKKSTQVILNAAQRGIGQLG